MTSRLFAIQHPTSFSHAFLWIAFLSLGCPNFAWAYVTSVGSVNPVPPIAGGTISNSLLTIGSNSPNDPNPVPFGSVTIDAGSYLEVEGSVRVGEGVGAINVNDAGSWLNVQNELIIGDGGVGTLNVTGGSVTASRLYVTDYQNSTVGIIRVTGSQSSILIYDGFGLDGQLELRDGGKTLTSGMNFSTGTIIVDGFGSILNNNAFNNSNYGSNYNGLMQISGGGRVFDSYASLGSDYLPATATVTGIGTSWQANSLAIGSEYNDNFEVSGDLLIEDQAQVIVNEMTISQSSNVQLDNGFLSSNESIENSGFISGRGSINVGDNNRVAGLTNNASGIIRVNEQETLTINGSLLNRGLINIQGGTLDVKQSTSMEYYGSSPLDNTPTITLDNAEVYFRGGLGMHYNTGRLMTLGGTNNIFGDIDGVGILVLGNSNTTFYNDVYESRIDVQSGSTLTILGDLTLQNEFAAIGLTDSDSPLFVGGRTELSGELNLTLSAQSEVEIGDQFGVISFSEGFEGMFDQINMPEIEGIQWELDVSPNNISLIAIAPVAGLQGDYNSDGTVDAADYTVWRDALSTQNLAADSNNDNLIDEQDYIAWVDNYGASNENASSATIPEPSSIVISTLSILGYRSRKRVSAS